MSKQKSVFKIKGRNRISKFRRITKELVSAVSSLKGVMGIMISGAAVRGFADEFSDMDINVILERRDPELSRKIRDLASVAQIRYQTDVDMEVYSLHHYKRKRWGETERSDCENSRVVYDPTRAMKRIGRHKMKSTDDFWTRRIVTSAEYLRWYCNPSQVAKESLAEVWISRGDLISAHYCLNYSIELLLRILFALNKKYLPPPKWRLFDSYGLSWLPKDYTRLVREAMKIGGYSRKEISRRRGTIAKLWKRIMPRMRDLLGLGEEGISRRYVRDVLKQE